MNYESAKPFASPMKKILLEISVRLESEHWEDTGYPFELESGIFGNPFNTKICFFYLFVQIEKKLKGQTIFKIS